MTETLSEPLATPALTPDPIVVPETRTEPETTGYIRLYSDKGGPVGKRVPARYRLTYPRDGSLLVDLAVTRRFGPHLTLKIPRHRYADEPHMAAMFTPDGMLVTIIYEAPTYPAAYGVGGTFTMAWKCRSGSSWCSPGWPGAQRIDTP